MAQFVFNIPDAILPRVIQALCTNGFYQDTIPDPQNVGVTIPNPQTRAQFAKAMIVDFMRNAVAQYESKLAGDAARVSAVTTAKADIIIT